MKRALVLVAAAVAVAAVVLVFLARRGDDSAALSSRAPGGSSSARTTDSPTRPSLQGAPAVPPELAAAKLERELALAKAEQSGKVVAPWANDGNLLLEAIAHDAHAAGWTQAGCFAAGCAGTFLFASDDAMTRGRALAEALAGYRAWTGSKHWTAPERWLDGRVSITLVLGPPS